jgi:hypothetical protein
VTRCLRLFAVPVVALGLTGCGGTVSGEVLAADAEDALERQVGVRTEIVCPEDVPAEVGASARCVLTAAGETTRYGISVTVAALEDGEVVVDVLVDRQPLE